MMFRNSGTAGRFRLELTYNLSIHFVGNTGLQRRAQADAPSFSLPTMQSVRQIERLNATELEKIVPPNASWHTDYRDTAYIHIGGLPFELSEGDILTIFSQFGNPVHLNLVRDKETGKSRGFAFLKYEDQRSCDLAVDNLSGAGVMGRVLGVDHCRYTLKEGEVEGEGLEAGKEDDGEEIVAVEEGRRKRRRISEEPEAPRAQLREELELAKLLREGDEEDPMKAFLIKEKREEVAEALKALTAAKPRRRSRDREDQKRHHRHRSRREHSEDQNDRERNRNGDGRSTRTRDDRSEEDGPKSRKHRSRRDDERRRRSPSEDRKSRPKPVERRSPSVSDHERRRYRSASPQRHDYAPDEKSQRRDRDR
ncbi:RNA-binding protein Cwf29 [Oleoguttula sp. CCFEE 5521]